MGLLTTRDMFSLIGPNNHRLGLLTTHDRCLLLGPKHLKVHVCLLTTRDIFILIGPNNLSNWSTYY